ncbi:hypothetical protein L0128_10130 [candidate division KSB1 bacterium]|nr:hypothetical protein [candidate division KSB1 bacterium]
MNLFKSKPQSTSFFITCLFLLNTLVNLVKFENNFYFTTIYWNDSDPFQSEWILYERTAGDIRITPTASIPIPTNDLIFNPIDFSAQFKYSLIYYQHLVDLQLKTFAHAFSPYQSLGSPLPKSNIWHQSAGEVLPTLV